MRQRQWEKITAIAGLAATALCVGALASWGNPQYDDPISRITNFYVKHPLQVFRSQTCFVLFGLALLVFATGLRVVLERDAGETRGLPPLAQGAAVLNLAWMMVWAAVNGGLALVAGQLSSSELRLAVGVETGIDFFTGLSFGLVALTAALAMLERGLFTRWIAWFGVVAGGLSLAGDAGMLDPTGPLGNAGFLGFIGQLLFLIWLIVVGVSLLRHSPVAAGRRQPAPRPERVPA